MVNLGQDALLRASTLAARDPQASACAWKESMEERNEKPPEPLKTCAQVSGTSLPQGDPELRACSCPSLTAQPCRRGS